MKKTIFILSILILVPFFQNAQSIENIDYISSFNDGLAAIKKDNQWAFINTNGDLVIDFRNDLVTTKSEDGDYPIFNDGRCLIVWEKDDISYFGYIDKKGEVVIEPQFLNASNFTNNQAIALLLYKEILGENDILKKNVVNYKYYEVVIDVNGETLNYLTLDGVNVILDHKFLVGPPKITSKLISDNLYVTLNKNNTWTIKKINNTVPNK